MDSDINTESNKVYTAEVWNYRQVLGVARMWYYLQKGADFLSPLLFLFFFVSTVCPPYLLKPTSFLANSVSWCCLLCWCWDSQKKCCNAVQVLTVFRLVYLRLRHHVLWKGKPWPSCRCQIRMASWFWWEWQPYVQLTPSKHWRIHYMKLRMLHTLYSRFMRST